MTILVCTGNPTHSEWFMGESLVPDARIVVRDGSKYAATLSVEWIGANCCSAMRPVRIVGHVSGLVGLVPDTSIH